ncbi:MAG: aldo/keto reductase, partial [Pseudomonadales bacterium]
MSNKADRYLHNMQTVHANGAQIPALGFGTWDLRGSVATDMVRFALDIGYRHIDTAVMYNNETEVGAGLRLSGVSRGSIFLTTKIWPTDFAPKDFHRALQTSLQRLQVDYVDLLLLHWPNPDIALADTLGTLAQARKDGLARHIGVSNFNRSLLNEAVSLCDEPLVVNQIEYHPFLDQRDMVKVMGDHDIALAAYCPIARGRVFNDPVLSDIA